MEKIFFNLCNEIVIMTITHLISIPIHDCVTNFSQFKTMLFLSYNPTDKASKVSRLLITNNKSFQEKEKKE